MSEFGINQTHEEIQCSHELVAPVLFTFLMLTGMTLGKADLSGSWFEEGQLDRHEAECEAAGYLASAFRKQDRVLVLRRLPPFPFFNQSGIQGLWDGAHLCLDCPVLLS